MRRVAVEKVRPDYHAEVKVEEGYLDKDEDDDRFAEEETPVVELAGDLTIAEENTGLKKKVKDLEEMISTLQQERNDTENLDDVIETESSHNESEALLKDLQKRFSTQWSIQFA